MPFLARGPARSALLAALLGVLATLPGCITVTVWSDHRQATTHAAVAPAELRAFALAEDVRSFALQITPAASSALQREGIELPPAPAWVVVCARTPGFPVEPGVQPDPQEPRRLVAFRETAGVDAPILWTLDPRPLMAKLAPKPPAIEGFRFAACTVAVAPDAATASSCELHDVAIELAVLDASDTPLLARLALTPPAVVGDACVVAVGAAIVVAGLALAPFGWVAAAFGGDQG